MSCAARDLEHVDHEWRLFRTHSGIAKRGMPLEPSELTLLVLLFVFWYCHKRGKETRLIREKTVDSNGRIVELEDDPMVEGPPRRSRTEGERAHRHESSRSEGREGPRREGSHRDDRGDDEERREHHHSSNRDHLRPNGPTTPSRSRSERNSPRRSAERSTSSEYATSSRREDDRHDRR